MLSKVMLLVPLLLLLLLLLLPTCKLLPLVLPPETGLGKVALETQRNVHQQMGLWQQQQQQQQLSLPHAASGPSHRPTSR